jgi:hypothetical protein
VGAGEPDRGGVGRGGCADAAGSGVGVYGHVKTEVAVLLYTKTCLPSLLCRAYLYGRSFIFCTASCDPVVGHGH